MANIVKGEMSPRANGEVADDCDDPESKLDEQADENAPATGYWRVWLHATEANLED